MSCRRTAIILRVVAVGFLAECTVCGTLLHCRLPYDRLDEADDVQCSKCRGSCEVFPETSVAEWRVNGTLELST